MRTWPVATLVLLVLASGSVRAADADGDGLDDAQEQSLLDSYSPVLYLHPEEAYFPVAVRFALDHSVLERYNDSGAPIVVDPNPTAAELATYDVPATGPGDVYYLNNTRGSIRDDGNILAAYAAGSYPPTVYGHVAIDGARTVVQFWFFYAYNPGVWNRHEGDWEMVEVVLDGGSPATMGFSQHESGERVPWADVGKDGTHPFVYVARGAHASYSRAYEGRFGIAGDLVSDAGPRWGPDRYQVINIGERDLPTPGNEWLRFAGRWGEYSVRAEARAEAGPPGPAYRQGGAMFSAPAAWADRLSVPDAATLLLDWSLANLLLILLVALIASFAAKVFQLWRLRRTTRLGWKLWPFAHLLPFDRKSVAMVVALAGVAVGVLGFFLPWYGVTADVAAPGFLVTDGPVEVLRVDGVAGLTVNPLREGGGRLQVNVLPLPVGLILAVLTPYFLFRLAGTKTARRLGARFILRGVVVLLPLIFVVLLASLLVPNLPAEDPGQIAVVAFVRPIAESPFGGAKTVTVEGGTGTIAWGLGLGSWLLTASAVVMFVAGMLARTQTYDFRPPQAAPTPEPGT